MKLKKILICMALSAVNEGRTITHDHHSLGIDTNRNPSDGKMISSRDVRHSQESYAPSVVPCPSKQPTIRIADALSPAEISWLALRRKKTLKPMIDWISRANINGFDTKSYINSLRGNEDMPNIAIAISGGGYRSLLTGGGFLAAADDRTAASTKPGHIGGLLQCTTYISGLSGGGWLVSSIFANNFSTVETLRDGKSDSELWRFDRSLIKGPERKGKFFDTLSYFRSLSKSVLAKKDAGFNTSATDFWGRALSFQLIDSEDGAPDKTFSSLVLQDNFKSGSTPFPIIVSIKDPKEEVVDSLNSNVYEMNPFELGSWDTNTNAFAPMKYLGSNFSGGIISPNGSCVKGFDQFGFLVGTTSTLFEVAIDLISKKSIPSFLRKFFDKVIGQNDSVAQFQPNPFLGFNPKINSIANDIELSLVDGGIDGQNLPLVPLLQPQRKIDVIFAVDSSADFNNFPNGASMIATLRRSLDGKLSKLVSFPSVPDNYSFVSLGLNKRPTFFGCDDSDRSRVTPMVIYIPNSNYVVASNISTFKSQYERSLSNDLIRNGYEMATMGNGTLDQQWPACLACAVLSRSMTRTKTQPPATCKKCFGTYCWNESSNQPVTNKSKLSAI
ncbi:Lysophospholipase [Golovinomyces cichoracearum]|uniref:Lysophospholipase n=1 Tax=Golovinomyces cichoracearum TaxID=62708 RepID=A0A420HHQ7_9PEZI|nr:Lysophospholipase [Golovinomyces cichoracearum]